MSALKTHLYYLFIAFTRYRRGFFYLYMRYWVAPAIARYRGPLEKAVTHPHLTIHMLFGARDFTMALWSLASYYRVSRVIGRLYVHSDGTLSRQQRTIISRLFPSSLFVDATDILETHKDFFAAHPTLETFRRTYTKFQSKKLLDPYLSSDARFRLILDSDMLWFKNPDEIEANLASRAPRAMMMSDGEDGFAYVTFKDGTRLSDELASYNSGITLYAKEHFAIAAFEEYLARIDYLHTRFTDQACYATLLKPYLTMLPKDRYIIKGALTSEVVMRHYTSPSRAKFYILGLDRVWKDIVA